MDWEFYKKALESNLVQLPKKFSNAPNPNLICDDSRTVCSDSWFLPLVGEKFDGHQFIAELFKQNKIVGAFVEVSKARDFQHFSNIIVVKNSLLALQQIAKAWRELLECKIIALTGSSGKTTTKEILASALSACGNTLFASGSFNNEIGVPKTILRANKSTEFLILEFGARNRHDIQFLTELANPDVVLCLNIGSAHLGIFGDKNSLFMAKTDIFRFSKADSILIANADDPKMLQTAQELNHKIYSFGKEKIADFNIIEESISESQNLKIKYKTPIGELYVETSHLHLKTASNIAAALACSYACDVDLKQAAKGISAFTVTPGRFKVHKLKKHIVIDDAYNANPESVRAGLDTLSTRYPSQKKMLILGDMRELGADSEKEHRAISEHLATLSNIAALFTIGEDSAHILEECQNRRLFFHKQQHYKNVEQFKSSFVLSDLDADIIYIKGSNALKLQCLVDFFSVGG